MKFHHMVKYFRTHDLQTTWAVNIVCSSVMGGKGRTWGDGRYSHKLMAFEACCSCHTDIWEALRITLCMVYRFL